jgi:CcmD family protein
MKSILAFLVSLLISANNIFAQSGDVEMADAMRSDGKIFVVVGVIAIVFSGIVLYLISIDRKVSRLEKKIKNEEV